MEMYTCTHISTLGCRNLWGALFCLPHTYTHIYKYIDVHMYTGKHTRIVGKRKI